MSGPYSVTFRSPATTASFNVAITQDSVLEGDENFNIAVDPTSLTSRGVSLGIPSDVTVTIVNDEGMLTIKCVPTSL